MVPVVWRSPAAEHTLNPVWQASHTFQYMWYVPVDTNEYRARAMARVSGSHAVSSRDKVTRFADTGGSGSARSPSQSFFPDSPGQDEVSNMLMQLTMSMPKLTSGLDQIQKQVVSLSARVDQLSASLRDRSAGVEGPGRPYDLRGVARGDAMSGLSLQPGRERDPKATFERSELNGRPPEVSSPVLEDSLEEVMNAVVN